MTDIPPTPVTTGLSTSATTADAQATTMPPIQVETAPEPLMPGPVAEVPIQLPMVDNQLGGSYITNVQAHNDSSNVSICSLDSEADENLKSHFNERLNNKVYSMFKELFNNINVDSIKDVLHKISVYNHTIARYIEDINLKCGITLNHMHLEVSEIGHWDDTFQVETHSNDQQQPPQPQLPSQPQQQILQVTTTSPQVQTP